METNMQGFPSMTQISEPNNLGIRESVTQSLKESVHESVKEETKSSDRKSSNKSGKRSGKRSPMESFLGWADIDWADEDFGNHQIFKYNPYNKSRPFQKGMKSPKKNKNESLAKQLWKRRIKRLLCKLYAAFLRMYLQWSIEEKEVPWSRDLFSGARQYSWDQRFLEPLRPRNVLSRIKRKGAAIER